MPERVAATPASRKGTGRVLAAGATRSRSAPEHLVPLLLGLLVLAVHDVGYMLSQPFWNDEAWVALTTRFPLSQLPATTSSTPIGWSALLRLVTVAGTETSRLLPLAFAGATVVAAYWFARGIGWRREGAAVPAGLAAGLGALLVPGMLVRDDLKQYTADAFIALLTLALTSRLEREWSRRRLAALSVSVWGGMLVSDAGALVGVAAFLALCLVQISRRAWRRLIEAGVAGVCTAALMLGVYEAFDARAVTSLGGSSYWHRYFLPVTGGAHADVAFVISHFRFVQALFGLGPVWLAAPLVLAGLVTIARLGRPATAIAVAALGPEMLALSALKKYPFLDLRTSTFLYAVTVVVAAIGLTGVCSLLWPWLGGAAAAGLAAVAVVAFAVGAQPYVRGHTIPNEDVRDQALYVAAHAAPDDVILVNLDSNWGFAYYWPIGHPARRPDAAVRQDYEAYYPGQPRIIVARNRYLAGATAALSRALARARRGSCTRIWLVNGEETRPRGVRITVAIAAERAAWTAALRQQGLSARRVGDHGLRVVSVGGPSCR